MYFGLVNKKGAELAPFKNCCQGDPSSNQEQSFKLAHISTWNCCKILQVTKNNSLMIAHVSKWSPFAVQLITKNMDIIPVSRPAQQIVWNSEIYGIMSSFGF